jgi:quercetin dioxygenase-like cupin family protein
MKSLIAPLTVGAALLSSAAALGQSPPTMNQEPHHQRLTYIRHMRVFELALAPGESTLDHTFDYDVAVIPLTAGTVRSRVVGADWSAPLEHAPGRAMLVERTGAPVTHRVENAGTTPFRAILIENLRERGWSMPPALTAPGTTLQQESRSFAVYDMRLNAGTSRTNHTHQNPIFIFVLSGAVEAQGGGGEFAFPLVQTGTWWFPGSGPDQPHTIELAKGSSDAHVLCIEAK